MTPEQVALIQDSFRKVLPVQTLAAAWFYGRLFELDPSLRPLFCGDMNKQGRKLMDALDVVVENLDDIESLLPGIRNLGRRHARYGAQAQHFETVGQALILTLEEVLGEDFTDDTREAWTVAYGLLASTMIGAMESAPVGMRAA
jgi:hemoglobin-like flavoprotein